MIFRGGVIIMMIVNLEIFLYGFLILFYFIFNSNFVKLIDEEIEVLNG